MAPALLTGRAPSSRVLTVPGNSWFALGPRARADARRTTSAPTPTGACCCSRSARSSRCDFAANAARERLRGGISVRELAQEVRQVYLIDLALAPLGLAVALAAVGHQWAVLLIAPLFGVLRWFSKERRARLEQLVELNDAYRGTALLLGDVVEADDTYTGEHCKDVVRLALDVARELGLDREAAAQRRVRGAAARRRQDRGAEGDRQQARQARRARVGDHQDAHRRGPADARARRRVHGRGRPDRALPPRALGRRRLPGWAARRGDTAGGADRLLLRRLQRDDHDALLSQGDAAGGGGGRAGEATRARSSTRRWSRRWWRWSGRGEGDGGAHA